MNDDQANDPGRRLADIERREAELRKQEQALAARGLRHNLYERVTLSRSAVDAIIIACAVAIVILVVLGAMLGGGK